MNSYIKLTRLDNTPIWINRAFIVTIEPRKLGGSVVVPIGDGLDYDVREAPDTVLAMLDESPCEVKVVPVPAPKMLAPKPAYVPIAPVEKPVEPAAVQPVEAVAPDEPPKTTAKKSTRTRKTATKTTTKKTTRATKAKKETAESDAAVETPAAEAAPADQPPPPAEIQPVEKASPPLLQVNEVERLRRMAPGSVRKLSNTLATQFKIANAEPVIAALVEGGVLAIVENDHVKWL